MRNNAETMKKKKKTNISGLRIPWKPGGLKFISISSHHEGCTCCRGKNGLIARNLWQNVQVPDCCCKFYLAFFNLTALRLKCWMQYFIKVCWTYSLCIFKKMHLKFFNRDVNVRGKRQSESRIEHVISLQALF